VPPGPAEFTEVKTQAVDDMKNAGSALAQIGSRPDVNQLQTDLGSILFGRQYNWLKVDLVTTVDFTPENIEVKRARKLLNTISDQTKERVGAVLKGLKAQTTSLKLQLDEIDKELETLRQKDVEATETYRPYFRAKRDLETLQKMRDALKMRIINEKVERSLPKVAGLTAEEVQNEQKEKLEKEQGEERTKKVGIVGRRVASKKRMLNHM
jgi:uncharacterized protein involved in exopolysaccharide biosynthesis